MNDLSPEQRIRAAGFLPWALDLSGRSYMTPDGYRVVTVEQAIKELDKTANQAKK